MVQGDVVPLSSWQVVPVTLDVASVAVKAMFTELPVVAPLAGLVMLTVGGVVSTLNVVDAEPTLPAASVAVTVIVWLPSASEAVAAPEVQAAAVPESTLQVVVVAVASVTLKDSVGVCVPTTAPLAGLLIETAGLVVSTVKVVEALAVAGVGLAESVAVTVIVWLPSASEAVAAPEVQAVAVPESILQVVLTGETPPVVLKLSVGVCVPIVLPLAGELMLTARPVATVKLTWALPTLPAVSVALTVTVWLLPAARPV